jgi:glutamine synthetase
MVPSDVTRLIKEKGIQSIDFKFQDFPGLWQHFSIPVSEYSEDLFTEGLGFDGSSIRGWRKINESDMLVMPDPSTAFIDPFFAWPTISLICNIAEPQTHQRYERDPRAICQKAANYLTASGIGDTAYYGPEAEFFIFDDVRFAQNQHSGFYYLDSEEGQWNSGRDEKPNLGYKPRYKEGYFPAPPTDKQQDIRDEMVRVMQECGIAVERQHHEVATAGQAEIDIRYDEMVKMADKLMLFKYIIKNVAYRNKKTVTFMPKPLFQDNGSGMHTHVSIWKGGKNLFAGREYAGLSESAIFFIGGILKHASSLLAITNPTTNSYKRLVPGYEAPVNLAYSQSNRSAAIRIPTYSANPNSKRVEFRCPDPSCNGYLAFAAILMAGLDGIEKRLHPGAALDKNIYDLSPEEKKGVPSAPASLDLALEALEKDHDYLTKGDVFTEDVIKAWIDYKMEAEVDALRMRPHPYEFVLYYDM